jgi:hypothetical protein
MRQSAEGEGGGGGYRILPIVGPINVEEGERRKAMAAVAGLVAEDGREAVEVPKFECAE